jgi:spoIIIJ-associated protein
MTAPKQNENLDVSAKTIDEAIEQGLARLGLTRGQVDIEIIKEGKRGVFGIGAEEAQVRLTPKRKAPEPTPAVAAPAPEPIAPPPPPQEAPALIPEPVPVTTPEPTASPAVEEFATRCLTNLLHYMGITAQVQARLASDLAEEDEKAPLVLDVTGGDLGILIGRQSETLQALQFMVRTMVSKQMGDWQPIVIDVESYRVRRRQSLQRLAERMAERVTSTGKKVVLEAMPAHERRIIHIALRDHPAVTTKSIGSDDNRKVTIVPK